MIIFVLLIIIFLAYDIRRLATGQQTFSGWVRNTGMEHPTFAVLVVVILIGLVAHFFL